MGSTRMSAATTEAACAAAAAAEGNRLNQLPLATLRWAAVRAAARAAMVVGRWRKATDAMVRVVVPMGPLWPASSFSLL